MIRRIFFMVVLWCITVYYSIKTMQIDPENCTPEEYDHWGLMWGQHAVRLAGMKLDIDMGDIDPNGHYVFICNHQSNLDIPALFEVFKGNRLRFVAKKSLFSIPFYGKALRHAGHICIDRDNRRAAMKSLNEAVAQAQRGFSPLIFPEGTRSTNLEELMDFKVGGMIIALKAGLPVVPVVMTNTGLIWGKGKKVIDNRHVARVKVLPAIDPSEYTLKDREKFKDDLYELMNREYKELLKKG